MVVISKTPNLEEMRKGRENYQFFSGILCLIIRKIKLWFMIIAFLLSKKIFYLIRFFFSFLISKLFMFVLLISSGEEMGFKIERLGEEWDPKSLILTKQWVGTDYSKNYFYDY